MQHITPYILIAAALTLSACSADSNDAPSHSSDESSSNNQGSTKDAKAVIGTWEQKIGESEHKSTFTASVTEDVITVD